MLHKSHRACREYKATLTWCSSLAIVQTIGLYHVPRSILLSLKDSCNRTCHMGWSGLVSVSASAVTLETKPKNLRQVSTALYLAESPRMPQAQSKTVLLEYKCRAHILAVHYKQVPGLTTTSNAWLVESGSSQTYYRLYRANRINSAVMLPSDIVDASGGSRGNRPYTNLPCDSLFSSLCASLGIESSLKSPEMEQQSKVEMD